MAAGRWRRGRVCGKVAGRALARPSCAVLSCDPFARRCIDEESGDPRARFPGRSAVRRRIRHRRVQRGQRSRRDRQSGDVARRRGHRPEVDGRRRRLDAGRDERPGRCEVGGRCGDRRRGRRGGRRRRRCGPGGRSEVRLRGDRELHIRRRNVLCAAHRGGSSDADVRAAADERQRAGGGLSPRVVRRAALRLERGLRERRLLSEWGWNPGLELPALCAVPCRAAAALQHGRRKFDVPRRCPDVSGARRWWWRRRRAASPGGCGRMPVTRGRPSALRRHGGVTSGL
jgi:hypothetical protein